jgi:hypothetical protein
MGPIGCPETSVIYYHSALRKIRKERSFCPHGGGNLKWPSDNECWRGCGRRKFGPNVIMMLKDVSDVLVKIVIPAQRQVVTVFNYHALKTCDGMEV